MGIVYVKKTLLVKFIGKPLSSLLTQKNIKNLLCRFKDFI